MATTDPKELPDRTTWYLTTNLPAPGSQRSREEGALIPADISEVVRLYGLRMWVEQSYKQVKHVLGWSDYQVRSDLAIRRHWQLVCVEFWFCWWAYGRLPTSSPEQSAEQTEEDLRLGRAGSGKKQTLAELAGGLEGDEGVAGTVGYAVALLEGVLRQAPTSGARSAA